jgi:alpha-beta hydrolase superfamily lysophospholipase
MFYYPSRAVFSTPESLSLDVQEVRFTSRDGTPLHGWFCRAQGRARGTVIHFHGNAENLTSHVHFVKWLPARGYHLFVWDYRGYGKSGGENVPRGNLRGLPGGL